MNWYHTNIKNSESQKYIDRFGLAWINTSRPHSARLYIKEWTKPPVDRKEIDIFYFSPECNEVPLINEMIIELQCIPCDRPNITDLYCPFDINS